MKQEDIRNLSLDDLNENLASQSDVYTKLKMNHAVSPLENPKQITGVKKTIARLKTELRKRELQGAQEK